MQDMFIKQLYTGCLSEAAYYIDSEGEAAIIDPLRDIDVYLKLAEERKSSPDLTHYRKMEQGERLDLLTFNIYNDPKYLLQVAKANSLSSIRNVQAGKELYFPPFDKNEI